jgi:hypothetical protein
MCVIKLRCGEIGSILADSDFNRCKIDCRKPYVMPSPKQLAAHAFQVGNPGGPGRPRGARSRLQEFTLQLIDEDFREHGREVLERVRQKHPQIYLMAVVGLLPKQQQKLESPLADFTDQEIAMLEEMLTASRAKLVPELEQNGAADSGTNNR